jgi:formylglycine-generating enzyme required for sulfatase activity
MSHEVGKKKPNAFGLYDMHGNVREWCWDWYGAYTGDVKDYTGPLAGTERVIRGGRFGSDADAVRSAFRGSHDPNNRKYIVGFRIMRYKP